jgi:radical SAM superfamily enzyme YgiQ (UPF0313 family)
MKVLLISANTETITMPVLPMGLGAVAVSAQRAGHEVYMLDLLKAEDPGASVREAVAEFEPQVIGVSVRNIDDQCMENPKFLLERVKGIISGCRTHSHAPIVLGGAGYSIFPQSTLAYLNADMGIQGEGEMAFPLLLSCLEEGSDPHGIPGLYSARHGPMGERRLEKNLDSFSLPGPGFWAATPSMDAETWVPFQTRRGCPMDCTYCSTRSIEGGLIRKRSLEAVLDAITRYREAGFTRFHFVDNLFNLPPSYADALCHRLVAKGLGISWRAIVYPAKLKPGVIQNMRHAGCVEVSLGLESGSDRMLRAMNKRFDREKVRRALEMFADQGIRRMGFLLLGGPGETRASVEESLAFVDSLHMDAVRITVGIRIYPHTALAETALREGIIPAGNDLLFPRFYLAPGLETWIPETVRAWARGRTNVIL